MRLSATLAAAALLACGQLLAGDFSTSARGTSTADFLNLAIGARAASMGGAYTSVADEATAVYWNPAAMTQVDHRSLALMHAEYIAGSFFDYVGYVHNAGNIGTFGFALDYFSPGKLTQSDDSGNQLGSYTPYDMALSWSYARKLGSGAPSALEGYSLGVTAKLVDSRIIASASAGALDIGLLSRRYADDRAWFSFTAINLLGDGMQFDSANDRLPMKLKLGSAFKLTPAWLASADAVLPQTDRPYLALGTEYWFSESGAWRLAGRAGYSSQYLGSVDGVAGLSMGFGVANRVGWRIDYGFVPIGGLGQAHRLSLTRNF